jgi:hypothetical protein
VTVYVCERAFVLVLSCMNLPVSVDLSPNLRYIQFFSVPSDGQIR